jgi:NAD(P)H-dependent FMN reductase
MLGAHLMDRLEADDVETQKLYVYPALRSETRMNALITATAAADLVVISAPLYVDSLPAAVTELLEVLHRQLDDHARPAEQLLVVISNCGFPEAEQNVRTAHLPLLRAPGWVHLGRRAGYGWW